MRMKEIENAKRKEGDRNKGQQLHNTHDTNTPNTFQINQQQQA